MEKANLDTSSDYLDTPSASGLFLRPKVREAIRRAEDRERSPKRAVEKQVRFSKFYESSNDEDDSQNEWEKREEHVRETVYGPKINPAAPKLRGSSKRHPEWYSDKDGDEFPAEEIPDERSEEEKELDVAQRLVYLRRVVLSDYFDSCLKKTYRPPAGLEHKYCDCCDHTMFDKYGRIPLYWFSKPLSKKEKIRPKLKRFDFVQRK